MAAEKQVIPTGNLNSDAENIPPPTSDCSQQPDSYLDIINSLNETIIAQKMAAEKQEIPPGDLNSDTENIPPPPSDCSQVQQPASYLDIINNLNETIIAQKEVISSLRAALKDLEARHDRYEALMKIKYPEVSGAVVVMRKWWEGKKRNQKYVWDEVVEWEMGSEPESTRRNGELYPADEISAIRVERFHTHAGPCYVLFQSIGQPTPSAETDE
ncbi:hypothetical protein BZA05DRAFT_419857 [Tricharina praecox]|uniref:uncharacterized protein n=1 Tax=Tricharina praecox TaxID=43433 RepID=UPI00221E7926|nr:uncharacterized protein BZA05DRAFT_419857 [Tricharina praecox]KAI5849162.1 hypothetical protein BZA05DRAFT_419857 [Tricharina praecox]